MQAPRANAKNFSKYKDSIPFGRENELNNLLSTANGDETLIRRGIEDMWNNSRSALSSEWSEVKPKRTKKKAEGVQRNHSRPSSKSQRSAGATNGSGGKGGNRRDGGGRPSSGAGGGSGGGGGGSAGGSSGSGSGGGGRGGAGGRGGRGRGQSIQGRGGPRGSRGVPRSQSVGVTEGGADENASNSSNYMPRPPSHWATAKESEETSGQPTPAKAAEAPSSANWPSAVADVPVSEPASDTNAAVPVAMAPAASAGVPNAWSRGSASIVNTAKAQQQAKVQAAKAQQMPKPQQKASAQGGKPAKQVKGGAPEGAAQARRSRGGRNRGKRAEESALVQSGDGGDASKAVGVEDSAGVEGSVNMGRWDPKQEVANFNFGSFGSDAAWGASSNDKPNGWEKDDGAVAKQGDDQVPPGFAAPADSADAKAGGPPGLGAANKLSELEEQMMREASKADAAGASAGDASVEVGPKGEVARDDAKAKDAKEQEAAKEAAQGDAAADAAAQGGPQAAVPQGVSAPHGAYLQNGGNNYGRASNAPNDAPQNAYGMQNPQQVGMQQANNAPYGSATPPGMNIAGMQPYPYMQPHAGYPGPAYGYNPAATYNYYQQYAASGLNQQQQAQYGSYAAMPPQQQQLQGSQHHMRGASGQPGAQASAGAPMYGRGAIMPTGMAGQGMPGSQQMPYAQMQGGPGMDGGFGGQSVAYMGGVPNYGYGQDGISPNPATPGDYNQLNANSSAQSAAKATSTSTVSQSEARSNDQQQMQNANYPGSGLSNPQGQPWMMAPQSYGAGGGMPSGFMRGYGNQ